MACSKRSFGSEAHAKAAVRTMGQTVRQYICDNCRAWHNTKMRDIENFDEDLWERGQRSRARRAKMNKFYE